MRPVILLALVLVCGISTAATEYPGFKVAGCLIATPQGVVLGVNRRGQLQLPMGHRKPQETAGQTAARETEEETGIEVRVGRLITAMEDNTVVLFQCDPNDTLDYSQLEATDGWEIKAVLVMNPHTRKNFDGRLIENPWRFKETEALLRSIFPQ